ncbi:RluA family pseudouridine synthase [Cytobacillus sp. FSL W7-1323]|uniref:Pseudouridine synthase n=1 Tax=Cytobacillus kochii TaxID=859143 RepID=A0A248TDH6_9BACI|nr:RluA family pseudouridine synthase [Cytobacillus kochii]ASV66209.1 RNA pseudouridine synthase [Cytobacillus kochii]MED1603722.1 RluA family pseudouridine synthase [Cytobacillus kochii]
MFTLQWQIDSLDTPVNIKSFLSQQNISKTALTDIKFAGGFIKVNGVEQNVRYMINNGDVLEVGFPLEKRSEGLQPENIPLSILYEDDAVLIVVKPAGMSTIPSREHPGGSLANALLGYYINQGIESTIHIVTRLDRETSGLVLIAKHRHVHHLLSRQQQNNGVQRKYKAFVCGLMATKEGWIEEPIGRKPDSIIERMVSPNGKHAVTYFKQLSQQKERQFTELELSLKTGRTHQIRVHLSHIGFPLVGDNLYGGSTKLLQRQALHCFSLSFTHPISMEVLNFSIPYPEDMQALLS